MTQTEKLQKIIERAEKNDYILLNIQITSGDEFTGRADGMRTLYWDGQGYCGIIFNHDFAKAYFGEKDCPGYISCDGNHEKIWGHHLEKLALTPPEERIDYLFNFISK